MSSKHYDIAIIGGSLTARIAAALLAKNGCKVLFLRNQEAKAPAWFHSSIFLEKLLGILGGRSCFVAPQPFQVISARSRITIGSDISLADELNREFGTSGEAVYKWLTELQRHGQQLEEFFWENGGITWASMKAMAHFKLLCMKRKINLGQLDVPVTEKLADFTGSAKELLVDLLQGLSLRSVNNLSYARAAMLWAQALRPENLKEPEFSEILAKRFDQFHGSKAALDDLENLDFDGSKWLGGRFKSGSRFTAKTFLLGDRRWLKLFHISNKHIQHAVYTPSARKTSNLQNQLSPLLATRVVCGGEWPMRLTFEEEGEELRGLALCSPDADETAVRRQLNPVLPFADFSMTVVNQPQAIGTSSEKTTLSLPLSSIPVRIDANLYHADRTAALPEMGAAGAALLAWTIFKNLGGKTIQGKE